MPVQVSEEALADWCRRHLGSAPDETLFRAGYLSAVVGVRLEDGREVVVKVRPASPRLDACYVVQRHAFEAGFPCPEPLVPNRPLGELVAMAEAYVPGGEQHPESGDTPELYVEPLARLVGITASLSDSLVLDPPLPWAGWAHNEPGLWPAPDDRDANLNEHPDAWLDGIAARVRARLGRDDGPRSIGHGDWYPSNLRWQGDELVAVHDWDSVVRLSAAGLAGVVASTFCVTDGATTMEQMGAFLDAYAVARERAWTPDEREIGWAAALWRIAFDAKKQSLDSRDGANESYLRVHGDALLRLAGA